jgi:hypothetical protein
MNIPVPVEVDRANAAVKGWYSNPMGLPSVFDSRNSRLRGSSRSSLGRIRRGLVGACRRYKKYKALWEYGLIVNPGAWAGLEIDKDYLQRITSV